MVNIGSIQDLYVIYIGMKKNFFTNGSKIENNRFLKKFCLTL
jgi:hypothetical protein